MKRCPKCGAANRKYAATCLKCGYKFNINNDGDNPIPDDNYDDDYRNTSTKPISSLFFTRHPYLLVTITIIMGWILIISILNEDLYPAKYNNSIISGCMLLSIGLVLVTTITRHLCPITIEFLTIGIGYFMLKSMGLDLSGNTGNIAWDITIYFSATLIFIVVCRMLLIMDSFIAYHDIGLLHEFIRYLRS